MELGRILYREGQLRQKFSALLGMAGGIVDLVAGFSLLQPAGLMQPSMMVTSATWGGYLLLVLGVIVLATGLYLLTPRMMANRMIFGVSNASLWHSHVGSRS